MSVGRNAVTGLVRFGATVSPDAKITLRGKHGSRAYGFPDYVNSSRVECTNRATVEVS